MYWSNFYSYGILKTMKNKNVIVLISIVIVVVLTSVWLFSKTDKGDSDIIDVIVHKDMIKVVEPTVNQVISSPLTISGEARGTWYFEANFPVRIEDSNGNELGRHYATAQGDWMTEEYVSFTSELIFTTPTTEFGILILEKSNPSGLPEYADQLEIPVQFLLDDISREQIVTLYYYNPEADTDENGNIMCSEAGLIPVEREIPITQTPIQDTIKLLIEGNITKAETEKGIQTEYPLNGFNLTGANLSDGVLTISFVDTDNQTIGGSCRTGILWSQIKKTAEQFDGVNEVRFQPEELFQP
jgi:hypothetical protein